MFKVFQLKTIPYMFKDFSQKSDLLERHTPYALHREYPPPPPPGEKSATVFYFALGVS